ncbi:MAG: adenylosuccinate lyase [Flavobacteriales bacterium]|jgi:adenylosuccinate lyase|nr:adenylosuccinate lyase [Flavobacteriales bacterium]MBK6891571.1 adenylosuccinate lyase [Flavobacteriales bacterium]MBK7247496.1 adenylosuccinate lyase [Flavobacteriales bacterium]MBK9596862.1 adenylosuccinate lyase [Flavobacteriales bacterium]QQS72785.1 MAG: adenylosuccinate lyase [Flavobacteriales bacterium]
MELDPLTAISPIDGRYRARTAPLAAWFSELALIRYRLLVELHWFRFLCEVPLPELKDVRPTGLDDLAKRIAALTEPDARAVKAIERTTNHDVKAVEYWLKEQLDALGFGAAKEFIHFGLTSQDINNTAMPLLLKDFTEQHYLPAINALRDRIHGLALQWAQVPMLARTHGQPASPTRLGKELEVFTERLDDQLRLLREVPFSCKFGGATGNFNAHHAAYPELDWVALADRFTAEKLGLQRQRFTTQIEHYDSMAALFDAMRRINTIVIDLCRDLWAYIGMDWFRQRVKAGEVGSSAMPHKVNPIDFENAEGNLGLANALFGHLSEKLPISRLQRDLTDSTVTRNIGVPMAHTVIAISSVMQGLDKLLLNEAAIARDLEAQWAVVAEGIQTILRREGYPEPYELLKKLTRGKEKIGQSDIAEFIEALDVEERVKVRLRRLSPSTYLGVDLFP